MLKSILGCKNILHLFEAKSTSNGAPNEVDSLPEQDDLNHELSRPDPDVPEKTEGERIWTS